MANYKDIHGINIETVASNPDNPANGQVWYNSTDQKLRANSQTTAGAWSSGGNLNTAKYLMGAAGTKTASIVAGGDPSPNLALSELYNGSSWTEVNDLNNGRYWVAGSGTSTAGLFVGGDSPSKANVESWNGTSWTEIADINQARGGLGTAGTTTANLA